MKVLNINYELLSDSLLDIYEISSIYCIHTKKLRIEKAKENKATSFPLISIKFDKRLWCL